MKNDSSISIRTFLAPYFAFFSNMSSNTEEVRAMVSKSVDRRGERDHFFPNLLSDSEGRQERALPL